MLSPARTTPNYANKSGLSQIGSALSRRQVAEEVGMTSNLLWHATYCFHYTRHMVRIPTDGKATEVQLYSFISPPLRIPPPTVIIVAHQSTDFFQSTRPFRTSDANFGPDWSHQNRTVSWLMSTPRTWSRSSRFRSKSGNRTYNITAKRMISGPVLNHLKGLALVMAER